MVHKLIVLLLITRIIVYVGLHRNVKQAGSQERL